MTPTQAGRLKFDNAPTHYRVVRLTNDQWSKSVQGALQLPSPPTNAENFQSAVAGTTDFNNNEILLDVDSRAWSDYQAAAEALAAQVSADAALLGKLYSGTDGAGFIKTVGRRFYRRPLTTTEASAYQKLFDSAATASGTLSAFAKGAGLVLEAMLQSPNFLYRTELSPPGAPLSSYEMAAKLSLWLRDAGPDDKLLDAAEGSGKLDTAEGAAEAAQKLLEDPAAKVVMRKFHGQFLRFNKFAELGKVGVAGYDPAINADLAESSYLFFDRVFSSGQGVREIFLSTKGFVSSRMAPLYGGAAAPSSGFEERELGPGRIGYFTQLPFLMLNAHNDSSDPIHRGVTMSLDVLCAPLGVFAGVLPPLPDVKPGETNRMRVDAHTKGCGTACHNDMINPLGFAFENFDGMGAYRETEKNGSDMLTIDASGSFNFTDGVKSYANATELMQVLASSEQTHLCYSKRLASYALQRNIVEADMPLLADLAAVSEGQASVKQVMIELVKRDAFRTRFGGNQ
ncbi:MAG: DUF1592 domain-containing protein [Myxococcota bacterium]|nr:DUF1592 domain-containing protein [Myxococcota bacterium]